MKGHQERYMRIGRGMLKDHGAGLKANNLDVAAFAGVDVPNGIFILEEALMLALEDNLVIKENGQYQIPDEKQFYGWMGFPSFPNNVAIRSAFSVEDGFDRSYAGHFKSVLNIGGCDNLAICTALCDVWNSAATIEGIHRLDIIMMEMVDAVHAGVAFTEKPFEDDLVNYATGLADKLVSGQIKGKAFTMPKLREWEDVEVRGYVPPFAERLQKLLKNLRTIFGNQHDWDVEWADTGSTCYLIQIRPVTRNTRRNEMFSIANHKEILPELPSHFMTTLIESCAADLFSYYRRFDLELPTTRPFIEIFQGRPLINLSLLTEMMRVIGLPTKLVTNAIGAGEKERPHAFNSKRFWKKWRVHLRFVRAGIFARKSVRQAENFFRSQNERSSLGFVGTILSLQELYTRLVTEMFSLTAAVTVPQAFFRWLGVLDDHTTHQQSIATRMYNDLEALRKYLGSQDQKEALCAGEIPPSPAFRQEWAKWLEEYGHRGVYESDIARPRFVEAPKMILASLNRSHQSLIAPKKRSWASILTWPLWYPVGKLIQSREALRHYAMHVFAKLRNELLSFAEKAVNKGQLRSVEDIWLLSISEVANLDTGWIPDQSFWSHRESLRQHYAEYLLPDELRRFDDLEAFHDGGGYKIKHRRLRGVGLNRGKVRGNAWVLSEPETVLPEGFRPDRTILITRSVDAGWIPTLSFVAGVIVESGGELAHGSILLRELGLPSITNVDHATRIFSSGDSIVLRASRGIVEKS